MEMALIAFWVKLLLTGISVLLGLNIVFYVRRKQLQAQAEQLIHTNDNDVVGQRAVAVTELRPGSLGFIRVLPENITPASLELSGMHETGGDTLKARSSVLISKGRTVYIVGKDKLSYKVSTLTDKH